MKQRRIILFAACSAGVAVAMGAFGAHGLQSSVDNGNLSENDLHAFETGVRYQFYHALALLILPALSQFLQIRTAKFAANAFIIGTFLFSGSLYLLALSPLMHIKMNWVGAITPFGGLFFITGWIALVISAIKAK